MRIIATVVLTIFCTACASVPDQTAEPRVEKVYRTGSNIPRDRTARSDSKEYDPSQLDDQIRSQSPTPPTSLSGH